MRKLERLNELITLYARCLMIYHTIIVKTTSDNINSSRPSNMNLFNVAIRRNFLLDLQYTERYFERTFNDVPITIG